MEYLEYFNLKEDPFRITPDPKYFYPSEQHNIGRLSLDYSIKNNEGFCLITGEPGTGKTLLLRMLINEWAGKAEIALVLSPRLTPIELLQAIVEDLNLRSNGTSKHDYIKTLQSYLLKCYEEKKKVIIVIDEAHQMPDETLEEVRLLSNLETEKEKLVHMILAGQTELYDRLESKNLRQLMQRISVKANLTPLSRQQIEEYINSRMRKAGLDRELFKQEALKEIHKYSGGIPRLINLLCSRSLMAAYVDGTHHIEKRHVRIAAEDLKIGPKGKGSNRFRWITWAVALGTLFLGGTGYLAWKYWAGREIKVEKASFLESPESANYLVLQAPFAPLRIEPSENALEYAWAKKGDTFRLVERVSIGGIRWYKVEGPNKELYWLEESDIGFRADNSKR